MSGIMLVICMAIKAPTFSSESSFFGLSLNREKLEGLSLGKRWVVAAAATDRDFNERLAVEMPCITERHPVLQLMAVFIEREKPCSKLESKA